MVRAPFRPSEWFLLGIIAVLFGVQLFSQLGDYLTACERGGDFSVLLLNVERASRFEALVGPYSRYRVAHPGPVVFYLYAAIDVLLFSSATQMGSAMLSQLFLNFFFALAAAYLGFRYYSRPESTLLLVGLVLWMFSATKVPYLHYIWNPAVLLVPCVNLLMSGAVIATKRSSVALLFTVSAIIVAQHHIAGAAFASAIGLTVVFHIVARRGSKELISAPYVLSYALVMISLIPPMIEALTEPRFGNFGRVWRHVFQERDAQPWMDSLQFMGNLLTPVTLSPGWNVGLVVVLFVLPWFRRMDGVERNLRTILAVSFLAGLYTSRGLHELTYDYIVWYLLGVSALQLWLLFTSVFDLMRLPSQVSAGLSFLIFTYVGYSTVPQSVHLGGVCEFAGEKTVEWLRSNRITAVQLQLYGRDAWGPAAAVVNNLVRNEFDLCVDRRWGFMFGRRITCRTEDGIERTVLAVAPKNKREGLVIYEGTDYVVQVDASHTATPQSR